MLFSLGVTAENAQLRLNEIRNYHMQTFCIKSTVKVHYSSKFQWFSWKSLSLLFA